MYWSNRRAFPLLRRTFPGMALVPVRASDHTPFDHTPFDHTPFDHTLSAHTPFDHTPFDQKPFAHAPFDHTPFDHKPFDHKPFDHKPSLVSPFWGRPFPAVRFAWALRSVVCPATTLKVKVVRLIGASSVRTLAV